MQQRSLTPKVYRWVPDIRVAKRAELGGDVKTWRKGHKAIAIYACPSLVLVLPTGVKAV